MTGDVELMEKYRDRFQALELELGKVIVGQSEAARQLIAAVLCGQHCFLEGAPGLAKTLMVHTAARLLCLEFRRIQFTPDLLPTDLVGTEVLEAGGDRHGFRFLPGPLFAHVVLADEINRTPAKTQAALLEAMEDRKVTVGGVTRPLPEPFHVFATQNPIEQEGTYRLPQAQMDRFLFQILIDYPEAEEEKRIVKRTTGGTVPGVRGLLEASELVECQELIRRIPVPPHVRAFAVDLARATRERSRQGRFPFLQEWVAWGASPRGGQGLILAARARALMEGRLQVSARDVEEMACPVLRHRLVLTYHAHSEGVRPDDVIRKLVERTRPSGNRMKAILPKVCA